MKGIEVAVTWEGVDVWGDWIWGGEGSWGWREHMHASFGSFVGECEEHRFFISLLGCLFWIRRDRVDLPFAFFSFLQREVRGVSDGDDGMKVTRDEDYG